MIEWALQAAVRPYMTCGTCHANVNLQVGTDDEEKVKERGARRGF